MKKILLIILLVLPLITFANTENVTFNLSSSIRLDENDWETYLWDLKIDLWEKTTKNLNFLISNNDYLIFANDVSNIEINSLKTNINDINLVNGNKILKIELKEEISWELILKWVKIRTYDQRISWAKIWFDYNNDNIADLYSINIIDLDENGRHSDNMKPLPVWSVGYDINKNTNWKYNIIINWEKSPDLDIYWSFVKVNKNNNYGNIKEEFIWKLDNQIFSYSDMDLEKDTYRFEIYSKDFYYLNTDPYIIELDKDDLIVESEIEEEVVDTETTETQIIDEETQEELIPVIVDTIETVKVEKYIPVYIKFEKALNDFVRLMDKYISIKKKDNLDIEQENSIMIVRNNIVKITEKLDLSSKDNRQDVFKELVEGVNELKEELKK